MTSRNTNNAGEFLKITAAFALTAGLVLFLVAMRLVRASDAPTLTLRTLNTSQALSLPAPPPPPPTETPPPPPPQDLPVLKIELDSVAPPVKATPVRDLDLRLNQTEFAPISDAPLAQMTFSAADLDSQPRLVNRPAVTFPLSQRQSGVTQAKVVLEVLISSGGTVAVQRVLESPHDDFTAMARSFATRARFTPPKKDGRPVNALFKWPLILKP